MNRKVHCDGSFDSLIHNTLAALEWFSRVEDSGIHDRGCHLWAPSFHCYLLHEVEETLQKDVRAQDRDVPDSEDVLFHRPEEFSICSVCPHRLLAIV